MTLFSLEGLSASGKSTVRDILMEDHPSWVFMKGENLMRKGVGEDWVDYQERYHEFLHRLYELNPENVIVVDRGFSEVAYNSDEQKRVEFKRLVACYGDAHVLYFYPGMMNKDRGSYYHGDEGLDVLRERGSRDLHRMSQIRRDYIDLLDMMDSHTFNTDVNDPEETAEHVEDHILTTHDGNVHNPDI